MSSPIKGPLIFSRNSWDKDDRARHVQDDMFVDAARPTMTRWKNSVRESSSVTVVVMDRVCQVLSMVLRRVKAE